MEVTEEIPRDVFEAAQMTTSELLPQKSRDKYERTFDIFEKWCQEKGVKTVKEEVLLFYKLQSFIKKQNVRFKLKKASNLSKEEGISTFINEAPDDIYLLMKVATIFGLAGACRREKLSKIFTADIEDKGNLIVKGKCTKQCVGINSFGKMPSEIAAFLKLPNPELYTGHSFRRSSATLLATSGEGLTDIKRLGGWNSARPRKPVPIPSSSSTVEEPVIEPVAAPVRSYSFESKDDPSDFPINRFMQHGSATNCTFNSYCNNFLCIYENLRTIYIDFLGFRRTNSYPFAVRARPNIAPGTVKSSSNFTRGRKQCQTFITITLPGLGAQEGDTFLEII
ncbi:hypothetical protein NQ317_007852 [Molorchus minor]|uniref:Tyr recombinase domain-containing protein n=1 Tax=Molorchus minor TaxID=1323400 RepID=A0ABQ9JSH0_9CUCU|nr:hypothetical protein NQ317_007852 [Molorchus minor]